VECLSEAAWGEQRLLESDSLEVTLGGGDDFDFDFASGEVRRSGDSALEESGRDVEVTERTDVINL
jgi:hypothetical protein